MIFTVNFLIKSHKFTFVVVRFVGLSSYVSLKVSIHSYESSKKNHTIILSFILYVCYCVNVSFCVVVFSCYFFFVFIVFHFIFHALNCVLLNTWNSLQQFVCENVCWYRNCMWPVLPQSLVRRKENFALLYFVNKRLSEK